MAERRTFMHLRAWAGGTAVMAALAAAPAAVHADGIEGRVVVASARDSRDAVIYVAKVPGETFAPPTRPPILDQANLAFQPHVLPVLAGTRVAFTNSDEVRHNVFSPTRGSRFDLGSYPRQATKFQVFDTPGVVTVLCNVHAEMSAYVVVVETPYFAVSDKDGRFVIRDVPPGTYDVIAWHEHAKPVHLIVAVTSARPASVTFKLAR
jgi:hypothetical protein